MRWTVFALLLPCVLALVGCKTHLSQEAPAVSKSFVSQTPGVYRHVVVFKFKPTTTQAQIDSIVADFADLPNHIDTIIGFEYGTNVSPEGLDQGFTHCFLVTFEDRAGLDVYLPHPAHKAFVQKLLPLLDQPFVVDYVAQP